MSYPGLTLMTRVEVVMHSGDVAMVTNLLASSGVTGYTTLTGVSGFGHSGYHEGRLLFNDTDTLALLLAVMPPDRAAAVIEGVREMLADRSGVMFVSDTYVSRPAYFTGHSAPPLPGG